MNTALLLVDLQEDYLGRPGLSPERGELIENAERLLLAFRHAGRPVFHAISLVDADGANRMPHWQRTNIRQCVAGTAGAMSPASLAPINGEQVFVKPFFSAFGNPDLLPALKAAGIERLAVAGLYTHACVRATVLDAYQAGLEVVVVEDAVASCEPDHARISLAYLDGRAATLATVAQLVNEVQDVVAPPHCQRRFWQARNPSCWDEILGEMPIDGPAEVERAIHAVQGWQKSWANTPMATRLSALQRLSEALQARKQRFIAEMGREIGKPYRDAESEWHFAMSLLTQSIANGDAEETFADVCVRYRPRGVIGMITPWNNPLSIPLGKLVPALLFGNSVVWKPAPQVNAVSTLIHDSLVDAGLSDAIRMVRGDRDTGQWLARLPGIDALSFTGSIAAGRLLAVVCAQHSRVLQAELGGNNAVLVMAGVDIERAASDIAEACFSFSGQRCTAPRRIIVEQSIQPQFEAALVTAVESLVIGQPADPATQIGPVVSRQKQQDLLALVDSALAFGGRLLCGNRVPKGFEQGCWLAPTLVADPPLDSPIVREESFGPVAVVLGACDIDHALTLCNGVEQGLVASLFSNNVFQQQRFLSGAQAGILSINRARPPFSVDAPFGGWKASGLGMPEHGRWDRDFYTLPQAVYRS